MKYLKYCLIIFILSIVINDMKILAIDTGFSTETLSEDECNTFLNNVNITVLTSEPKMDTIDCFDVNEDGLIAIGSSISEKKTICVYTDSGDFKNGYTFKSSGSFGVEWDETNLIIYFVRSDVAVSVDTNGRVENILKIQNTVENNAYWNNSVFSTKRNVNGSEYELKNDMGFFNIFASSYSQLVEKNNDGEETILFDINAFQYTNVLVIFIGVLIIAGFSVFIVVRQFIKLRKSDQRLIKR